jgi:hypothetical protein
MIAGAHRDNHPTLTTCDGTHSNGDPYHISDVAHATENYFHWAHLHLFATLPDMAMIQFHGFCCPGSGTYAGLSDDTISSNGINEIPAPLDLARLIHDAIEAQMFFADDGIPGGDLTTCGLYGEEVFQLGGTTNIQGRVMNGVVPGLECENAASTASGRFVHLEQDPDVREEPQHIIDAIEAALLLLEATAQVEDWWVVQ